MGEIENKNGRNSILTASQCFGYNRKLKNRID